MAVVFIIEQPDVTREKYEDVRSQVVPDNRLPDGMILHLAGEVKDGGWRVADVISDGVSDLSLQTEQYAKLYKEKGFDGLVAWLQNQTRKMRGDCGAKAAS